VNADLTTILFVMILKLG